MDELIDVSVVGQPVVYAAGFVALLLVLLTKDWAAALPTVVHEGGHMVMAVLTFRGFSTWKMTDGDSAETKIDDPSWGVGDLIVTVAGYLSPPLVGLGLAAVLAGGNAWGVLTITLLLVLLSFLYAKGGLANLVTAVLAATIAYALWRGSATLQVALAAGAVWLLLLGGVRAAWIMGLSSTSDAHYMRRGTAIPKSIWKLIWLTIALACLYAGGRLLFVGEAWPDGVWPFNEQA